MKRQNVIVVIAPTLEVWGNFKKLCEAKGFDILPMSTIRFCFKKAICHDFSSRGNGKPKTDRGYRAEYYFTASDGTTIRRRKRFSNYQDAKKWVEGFLK